MSEQTAPAPDPAVQEVLAKEQKLLDEVTTRAQMTHMQQRIVDLSVENYHLRTQAEQPREDEDRLEQGETMI